MLAGIYTFPALSSPLAPTLLCILTLLDVAETAPGNLILDYSPAPPPEEGAPAAAGAIRDPAYLPAQVGGIVGAYALCLVLVAVLLLVFSKRRREHLTNGADAENDELEVPKFEFPVPSEPKQFPYNLEPPRTPRNFSNPSLDRADPNPYILPSSPESLYAPGVDPHVDQQVVRHDREMAQQQLEEMYKLVMEQEEAKQRGIILDNPVLPGADAKSVKSTTSTKKEKNKPAQLNLKKEDKSHSRTSSILSALRSPRKKQIKGVNISSPIMTPMSGTFPRHEEQEMSSIPPRQYAPLAPPPVPTDQAPYPLKKGQTVSPPTPEHSPESTMSIDERLRGQLPQQGHSRNTSAVPSEPEQPVSATSERSTSPLVGLPSSPKPGVNRFPSLPQSPKPGQSFSRPNAPSAVRTGGALPLRAYEPSLTSPSASSYQTKQTVFERAPMSPGARTPFTGAPVPYSPYQPQTPCIPITPSLVTKADRKRMKRFEPKTPTLEMVRSSEDIW